MKLYDDYYIIKLLSNHLNLDLVQMFCYITLYIVHCTDLLAKTRDVTQPNWNIELEKWGIWLEKMKDCL